MKAEMPHEWLRLLSVVQSVAFPNSRDCRRPGEWRNVLPGEREEHESELSTREMLMKCVFPNEFLWIYGQKVKGDRTVWHRSGAMVRDERFMVPPFAGGKAASVPGPPVSGG